MAPKSMTMGGCWPPFRNWKAQPEYCASTRDGYEPLMTVVNGSGGPHPPGTHLIEYTIHFVGGCRNQPLCQFCLPLQCKPPSPSFWLWKRSFFKVREISSHLSLYILYIYIYYDIIEICQRMNSNYRK